MPFNRSIFGAGLVIGDSGAYIVRYYKVKAT